MLRIRRYLKPYMFMFVASVILLFIQANLDLSLPDYLSRIVNTGIQQSGVESPVAVAMRQETFDHLLLFLNDEDATAVQDAYTLVEPGTVEAGDYIDQYPYLESQAIYVRKDLTDDQIDALKGPMAQAFLAVSALEQAMADPEAAAQMGSGDSAFDLSRLPAGTDLFALISRLPEAQRAQIGETMNQRFEALGETMVEQTAVATLGERFVPNDTHFGDDERIQIITGPNMSGKSTYLRQVALIVLMAQIGSFVPADSAEIGLVDRIFTRIGAHDELHAGRSTFMVEMVETAEILNHATHRSLLILDEIGRGTSTYDGLAIAWAIIEYLHNHPRLKPRTLFATHYHELVGLADLLPLVSNYNVAVAEEGDKVIFLHQIVPGGADQSYGIHVGQLAGLPRDVINRANEILQELEEHAPTTAVEPSRLNSAQQMALFPESSPILDELKTLDVNTMSPLEAINKLYEWKRRYAEKGE
ncbi:MAG: hypothetical protein KC434_10725 [Anaerolineales bacterium]|nr:hypothetical protein [Anaerolineales bacterium]